MENRAFQCEGKAGGDLFSDRLGYYYRVKEKRGLRWRLICHTSKCRGSGTLIRPGSDEQQIVHKTVHTCEPNSHLADANKLRKKILQRCESESTGFSKIFHEETTSK